MTDPDHRHGPSSIWFPTATRLRRLVQVAVLLLVLAIGIQFSLFVASCLDPSRPLVARPPGVAGFLPGLMGLKALAAWTVQPSCSCWPSW